MFDTKLSPPTIDQATIDHYVSKGRRERSRAFIAMIKALFSAPEVVETRPAASLSRKGCAA